MGYNTIPQDWQAALHYFHFFYYHLFLIKSEDIKRIQPRLTIRDIYPHGICEKSVGTRQDCHSATLDKHGCPASREILQLLVWSAMILTPARQDSIRLSLWDEEFVQDPHR